MTTSAHPALEEIVRPEARNVAAREVPVLCRGGRGEAPDIVIPPHLAHGHYVLEIADAVDPHCVAEAEAETDTHDVARPHGSGAKKDDLSPLARAVRKLKSNINTRITITNDT